MNQTVVDHSSTTSQAKARNHTTPIHNPPLQSPNILDAPHQSKASGQTERTVLEFHKDLRRGVYSNAIIRQIITCEDRNRTNKDTGRRGHTFLLLRIEELRATKLKTQEKQELPDHNSQTSPEYWFRIDRTTEEKPMEVELAEERSASADTNAENPSLPVAGTTTMKPLDEEKRMANINKDSSSAGTRSTNLTFGGMSGPKTDRVKKVLTSETLIGRDTMIIGQIIFRANGRPLSVFADLLIIAYEESKEYLKSPQNSHFFCAVIQQYFPRFPHAFFIDETNFELNLADSSQQRLDGKLHDLRNWPAVSRQRTSLRDLRYSPVIKNVLKTSPLKGRLKNHKKYVHAVTFSSNGDHLASASSDHTVRIWDTRSKKSLNIFEGHYATVRCVAYTTGAEGPQIASSSSFDVQLRKAKDGTYSAGRKIANVLSLASSPQIIAIGLSDGIVQLWHADLSGCIASLEEGKDKESLCVTFSHDGTKLASGSEDGQIRVWKCNLEGKTPVKIHSTFEGHKMRVESIAISCDGLLLASGSQDKSIRLWRFGLDNIDPKKDLVWVFKEHTNLVNSLAFSPETAQANLLISGSDDQTVQIWDTRELHRLAVLRHKRPVQSVAISPDGFTIASACGDRKVRLWDVKKALRWQSPSSIPTIFNEQPGNQ